MVNLTQLRIAAREIFDEALRAIDPTAALRKSVRLNESGLYVGELSIDVHNRKIYSIAIGKAARRMASGLDEVLDGGICGGIITTNDSGFVGTKLLPHWETFAGGHPEPNEASLAAARAAFDLLDRANAEAALVIFLISGGGSAMIEWPVDANISLPDLKAANKALVNCGASISEINSVRRAFSLVKGGKLAARAPNCDQLTLIISDVPPGEERNVASGPTLSANDLPDEALRVIERYNLSPLLPPSIMSAIESAPSIDLSSERMREQVILLDNDDATNAVLKSARDRGFVAELATNISDQPIEVGCEQLLRRLEARIENRLEAGLVPSVDTSADSIQHGAAVCLISGGEFACPVRGNGIGGRNLETALRLALSRHESNHDELFVALCAGTDGIDGNSPAAGAIVDSTTIDRAKRIGLNAEDFLQRSDSYSFFVALGDVITTGPTGTNVRDLRILIASNNRG